MSKLHVGPCPLLSEGARPESSGAVSSDVKKWQTCAVAESDRPLLPGTTAQLRLPALAPTKGHDRGHMPVFYHPDDVSSRGNPTHTWEGGARPATGRNVATPQQHSGIAFGTTSTPLERSREPVHSCRHSAFLIVRATCLTMGFGAGVIGSARMRRGGTTVRRLHGRTAVPTCPPAPRPGEVASALFLLFAYGG